MLRVLWVNKVGPPWIEVAQACPIELGSWECGGQVTPLSSLLLLMLPHSRAVFVLWLGSLPCHLGVMLPGKRLLLSEMMFEHILQVK